MKKRLKKLICIILLSFVILSSIVPTSNAGLSDEDRARIVAMAKRWRTVNNSKIVYSNGSQAALMQCANGGTYTGTFYDSWLGKDTTFDEHIIFTCTTYVAFIYRNVTGIGGQWGQSAGDLIWAPQTTYYNTVAGNTVFEIATDGPKPGDILVAPFNSIPHIGIYTGNGEMTHAYWYTDGVITSSYSSADYYVLRVKEDKDVTSNPLGPDFDDEQVIKDYDEIKKDQGEASTLSIIKGTGDSGDFYYNGLTPANYEGSQTFNEWLFDTLAKAADWLIGFMMMGFKMMVIGYTSVVENLANDIVSSATNTELTAPLTVENMVFNKIQLLDINIFNPDTAAGETVNQDSLIYVIKKGVKDWYTVFRNIAIIALLLVLIYIGIRMALASLSSDKQDLGKYKSLFKDWLVSFFIVFIIHYIMIFIIQFSESLTNMLALTTENADGTNLFEKVKVGAYQIPFLESFKSTLIYVILVYYMFKFLAFYFKRVIIIMILTIMAPLVAISYAIDKIKDNKTQSFATWLKEYIINVMSQTIHALVYVIFVSLSIGLSGNPIVSTILLFVLMNMMLTSEKIVKKIFGLTGQSGSSVKNVQDAGIGITTGFVAGREVAKKYDKMYLSKVRSGGAKLISNVSGRIEKSIGTNNIGVNSVVKTAGPVGQSVGVVTSSKGKASKSKLESAISTIANVAIGAKDVAKGLPYGTAFGVAKSIGNLALAVPMLADRPQKALMKGLNAGLDLNKRYKDKKISGYKYIGTSKFTDSQKEIIRKNEVSQLTNRANLVGKEIKTEFESKLNSENFKGFEKNAVEKDIKMSEEKIVELKEAIDKMSKLVDKSVISAATVDYLLATDRSKGFTSKDIENIIDNLELKLDVEKGYKLNLDNVIKENLIVDAATQRGPEMPTKVNKEAVRDINDVLKRYNKEEDVAKKGDIAGELDNIVDEKTKEDYISKLNKDEIVDLIAKTLSKNGSFDFKNETKEDKRFFEDIIEFKDLVDRTRKSEQLEPMNASQLVNKMIDNMVKEKKVGDE